jgi:hypothetical protein
MLVVMQLVRKFCCFEQNEDTFPLVKSQVLIAANMKMTVFWVVAPCSLVEVDVSEVLAASIIRVSVNFY